MWDDGVVKPSPACTRALQVVVSALKAGGHEVVAVYVSQSLAFLLILKNRLLCADNHLAQPKPSRLVLRSWPTPVRHFLSSSSSMMLNVVTVVATTAPIRFWEWNDPGVKRMMIPLRLPRIFNYIHSWFVRYILRDPLYADLILGWHIQDGQEFYALAAQREKYKVKWHDWWKENELDFLVTVPNGMPAVKKEGGRLGWKACDYSFLFNVVHFSFAS